MKPPFQKKSLSSEDLRKSGSITHPGQVKRTGNVWVELAMRNATLAWGAVNVCCAVRMCQQMSDECVYVCADAREFATAFSYS